MNGDKVQGSGQLAYSTLNDELLKRVPALRPGYLELRRLWDDEEPGPHIVYGDLFVPYLVDRLVQKPESPELVLGFELLEDLLRGGDPEIRDLVGATVLEGLSGFASASAKATRYMGPMTRRLAAQVYSAWQ